MDPKSEELKAILEHARDMFKYQAGQRHTSLNIYFGFLAAFVAGLVALFAQASVWTGTFRIGRIVGIVLGIAAIFVTRLCYLLDCRNQQLVNEEKALMQNVEQELAARWGIPCLAPTRHNTEKAGGGYERLVPLMLLVYVVLWVLAIVLSLFYAAPPASSFTAL